MFLADSFSFHSASVKGSKVKLERRVAEFLSHADSTERADFEIGRTNLLIAMSAAEREYTKKHAETSPEIEQHKVQAAKAKIKAGCKAFSAVAYEYSQIMDVLATQAPEYVALAWGAVKIVLVVQINHEELKIKVKEHMDLIRSRFEVINHLTAYNPRQNLVRAVAKAYELFSRFLAKAVKYYSMTKLSMYILDIGTKPLMNPSTQRRHGKHFLSLGKYVCKLWWMR